MRFHINTSAAYRDPLNARDRETFGPDVVDEQDALETMHRLAFALPGDPFVLSGESGGAGLAGLIVASKDAQTRDRLRLDQQSVALVFNTEGATDRALYDSLLAKANRHVGGG